MNPRVTRIHVEYEDGSFDNMELLPGDDLPLYDLRRKQGGSRKRNLGAHTGGAVAALLFLTASSSFRREYSAMDPDVVKLLTGNLQ